MRLIAEFFALLAKNGLLPDGRMRCVDCDCPVHRHDKYTILLVRHRSCADRKLVGQMSLEGEK